METVYLARLDLKEVEQRVILEYRVEREREKSGHEREPKGNMRDMADLLEAMRKMMEETGQNKREDKKNDYQKVILDEKYFRRMEVFDGDRSRFRGWIFDLTV